MSNYFKNLPDLLYLDRENKEIRTYARAKNLFRRIRIREISDGQLTNFEFYSIKPGERPDNVAERFYNDSTLDWVILLSNNILNVQTEWPLDPTSFEKYLEEKYGDTLYDVKHHESIEVRNSGGDVIFQRGIIVPKNFTFDYYDQQLGQSSRVINMTYEVTNYAMELRRQNELSAIRILKPVYIQTIKEELKELMTYKKNTSQYQGKYLKMVDDIRITL